MAVNTLVKTIAAYTMIFLALGLICAAYILPNFFTQMACVFAAGVLIAVQSGMTRNQRSKR